MHQQAVSRQSNAGAAQRSERTHTLYEQASVADPRHRRELHEQVVLLHLEVADSIAGRYAHRGVAREDLEQVARLALVKAVRGFDSALATDFMCYAVPCIRGELRRYFRDHGWAIRPPRRVQEARALMSASGEEMAQRLERAPQADDFVRELGLDDGTVREAMAVGGCYAPDSLDRPVLEGEPERAVSDRLGAEDPEFERCEALTMLGPLVSDLPERDREILRLRFVDGLTQREVGERVGLTQMQISRILARLYRQLGSRLGIRAAQPPAA